MDVVIRDNLIKLKQHRWIYLSSSFPTIPKNVLYALDFGVPVCLHGFVTVTVPGLKNENAKYWYVHNYFSFFISECGIDFQVICSNSVMYV